MRRLLADRRAIVALLVALTVAGGALRAHQAMNPGVAYTSADEASYDTLARNLARKGRYAGLARPLHWPPGAPLLFAAAYEVREPPSRSPYWAQWAVSTALIAAVFLLAALLAGPVAGLVAAALIAFYAPLIRNTAELLSEPLGALLLTCALAALVWALRSRDRTLRFAVAGVLFGLTVLTRADLLFAPFLVAGLLALVGWRAGDLQRGLRTAAVLAAATGLTLAPWTVYASSRAEGFVAVTEGDGAALFVGTYLPGDGTTTGMKRKLLGDARRPAAEALDKIAARHPSLSREAALRREARRNIRRYVLGDPADFAVLAVKKTSRMWLRSSRAGSKTANPWTRRWHFVLVLAAAAALLTAVWRTRSLALGAILTVLLYSTLLHALVVAKPRYNLPLMPLLIAGGAAGVVLLVGRRYSAQSSTLSSQAEPK